MNDQTEPIRTIRLGEHGYGLEEIEPLAKTIAEHGYAIAPVGMGGGGGLATEVLTIIQIGAGLGLGEFLRRFFGQAYDAWLKEPLASALFRQGEQVRRKPRLQIEGSDLTAVIDAHSMSDIDTALAGLVPALQALSESEEWRTAEKPLFPQITWDGQTWRVHGRRRVFAYQPDRGTYAELPREKR